MEQKLLIELNLMWEYTTRFSPPICSLEESRLAESQSQSKKTLGN